MTPFPAADALAFILRHWKTAVCGIALAIVGVMLLFARSDARHWHKQYDGQVAINAANVARWQQASADAKVTAEQNKARAITEQQAITEKTVERYKAAAADTATRYERLRRQADDYRSAPRSPDLSAASAAACHAYAATDCDAIPALLKAAQDNTDQLVALQAWVAEQAVVPNEVSTSPR